MTSRGVYRGLYSSLIDDPDYQRLSPNARLVLLTLRLCSQAGVAAIFRAYTAVVAEQTGLPVEDVDRAFAELEASPSAERPWIFRDAGIVWVRNALRYDPNIRLADSKHRTAIERAVAALPRSPIVRKFCRYYRIASPFDGPSKGLGRGSGEVSHPSPSPNTEYRIPSTSTDLRPSGSPNGHHPPTSGDSVEEVELP